MSKKPAGETQKSNTILNQYKQKMITGIRIYKFKENIKYILSIFVVTLTVLSVHSSNLNGDNSTNDNLIDTSTDKNKQVVYDSRRENLKLSVPDTIKSSKSFLFSNSKSQDLFQLTINPGLVKNSKSLLQILTSDKKVIFSVTFDTFYFIRGIFEPDTIPSGGQEVYEKYLKDYWQSLTLKQYEAYFKNSIKNFFKDIRFIDRARFIEMNESGNDVVDKDFLNEMKVDSTIRLVSITCFDCDEGGSIIGYSKKKEKVLTILNSD